MKKAGISSIFHYVPLHASQACKNFGRARAALAAKAAVTGMPALCWKGANSWIELNEKLVRSDLLLKSTEVKFEDIVFNDEKMFIG